jgi:hypothetical protein
MDGPVHISVLLARMGFLDARTSPVRLCGGTSRHRQADANPPVAPFRDRLAGRFSSVGSRRNPEEVNGTSANAEGSAGR